MLTRNNRISPFANFTTKLDLHWGSLANSTISNIETTQIEKGLGYDVKAVIRDRGDEIVASGQYNSASGIHAEIDALERCPPLNNGILSVSPSPCKRCAVILSHFRENHSFTIRAPERSFAPTNAGAYFLPDYIANDVIIGGILRAAIMNEDEARCHKAAILSRFKSGDW